MKQIVSSVLSATNIAIFSHIKTDCDAVCSSLAFKLGIESIGKHADVFIDSETSLQIKGLPHFEEINKKTLNSYDLYVCLDNADIDRLGKNKYKILKNRAKSVQLDHHGTNNKYCKLNYINDKYSATCELLYDFFRLANIKITPVMARLLLTGIYTDTGKLSFSNTTSNTLLVASNLLKIYGDTTDTICEPIFSSRSVGEFNMCRLAYNNAKLYFNNSVGLTYLTKQDFKNSGATLDDTHGITDILTSIKSVTLAIVISQDVTQDDCYYVSVRSKAGVSARNVAAAFGGGGHERAAGCKIFDTLESTIKRLLAQAQKAVM